ncbi:MAG: PKD domain-containing protein [Ferruginibacter sp.]
MPNFKPLYKNGICFCGFLLQILFTTLLTGVCYFTNSAQNCPPNIDFETGTFNGWTCYTGFVSGDNGYNQISLTPSGGPIAERHTMYSAFPGAGLDEYGYFPVNCPNGSGHSIRLGNNQGGGQAEGISYEFIIPANQNVYNLIYNYAVVFQDPTHEPYQQPRMEIEITNVTDNTVINCSSFTFFPNGSPLPGFVLSDNPGGDTPVWFKDWSAVSINLDGNAGKKIRLFFKTADCSFKRHFGYAYIDVNSECSSSFIGASFCPDDTTVNVIAPYGYQNYWWYDSAFTHFLGSHQTLTFTPPPLVGTTVAVVLGPYNGYGCRDTLNVQLVNNLTVTAEAGRDTFTCNHNPVPIGTPPRPGLVYSWTPASGLSNTTISNPAANPTIATTYVVTTKSRGGGCVQTDTILVKAGTVDERLEVIGDPIYCLGNGSILLKVHPTDSIQWFRDGIAITGANQIQYSPLQTGSYYARLFSNTGCIMNTVAQEVNIASIPVAGFITDDADQCLVGNKFSFTNTSSNAIGTMQFKWILGDGTEMTTRDVVHSYTHAGTYKVKMIVRSNAICADSVEFNVQVKQNAFPEFIAKAGCIDLPLQVINNTADTVGSAINYSWDFGNGQYSGIRNPPPPVYRSEGIYIVSLAVSTMECPLPMLTINQYVVIDKPKTGINYPGKIAVINLPLDLQARQIGETALWRPAGSLDNPFSFTPVFRGVSEQLFTIEIKTSSGCTTIDTQLVKTVKEIAIYVPTGFTPDNDGMNDLLRPTLIGIRQVRYFKVFNRWGKLMYVMSSDRPGWDGTWKGIKQEMQAYIWVIEAIGADGNIYNKKGSTILIR